MKEPTTQRTLASRLIGHTFRITAARIRRLKPQPLARPFQDGSMGPFHSAGLATITLQDSDGCEGEAPVVDVQSLRDLLLPLILQPRRPLIYEQLHHALYWNLRNAGFRGPASGALGAVDLALHDLVARRAGLPLHRFLGAQRDAVEVYASGGGTNLSQAELVREMCGYAEAGYRTLKLKVGRNFGRDPAEDVARVRAVRAALNPAIELAVDANQVWSAAEALAFARNIADLDIAWLEEPVHSADLPALRAVCAASPVPIAMGESEHCERLFTALVDAGVAHLQPIYHRLPSIASFQSIQAIQGVRFSSGGFTHYASQLVACGRSDAMTEFLVAINTPLEPWLSLRPRLARGRMELPSAPGISMRVDWDRAMRDEQILGDQTYHEADLAGAHGQI